MLGFVKNIGLGGFVGVMFFCFVYFFDYCRIRLVNDVKLVGKGGGEC